jgi:hypothetical protein
MSFAWAFTSGDKIRSSWTDSIVISATNELSSYPKENILDGNPESCFKATGASSTIVIDSGDNALDIDYLFLRFNYDNIPTNINIETSSDNSNWAKIANNLDGIHTHLAVACDPTSRIISIESPFTYLHVGNTVEITDSIAATKKYLIIAIGAGWAELDRFPESYAINATVTIVPDSTCLVVVGSTETKRYICLTITGDPAEIISISGFSTSYIFDASALPLNPYPYEENIDLGGVSRTISGHGIGKQTQGPAIRKYQIGIGRILKDGLAILDWCSRQENLGILDDSGEWHEVILTGMSGGRRQSSNAELISHTRTVTFESI